MPSMSVTGGEHEDRVGGFACRRQEILESMIFLKGTEETYPSRGTGDRWVTFWVPQFLGCDVDLHWLQLELNTGQCSGMSLSRKNHLAPKC